MRSDTLLFVPKGFNTQEPAYTGELQGEVVDSPFDRRCLCRGYSSAPVRRMSYFYAPAL
jgi:hypothetical protein